MSISIDRKRRAFSLLREALELPPGERADYVATHCGNDATLAGELFTWLGADITGDLLERNLEDIAADLSRLDEAELPAGTRVGTWRLRRVLGSGGMGVVYLAERDGEGYAQRGALKLIKRGMDSVAVLARFRRERQILARLNHPNIAHLLDGGIADSGQPFLVTTYVEGEAPADWARRTSAGRDARLALFLQLCDAVAYAHRQLVVHSDIKPGNVLVDAEGHPHLLDFGIAKLLADEAVPERTATAARFFSRAYAAPEQSDGGTITTATDVYQLGVLLFEWLTDTRHGDAPAATRSSQRLARARASAASSSPIPVRALRGDAGVIVARATDPDPARRYASVEAFADDLRRWRDGRPIRARPDSVGYRTRLFVRRHALFVAAAVVALTAILAGAGIALWQAHEARLQARRATAEAASARASQRFMLNVFTQAEPWRNGGRQPTALELAEDALERADTELADEPSARADMYHALSRLFSVAGDVRLAAVAATKAVAALEALPSPDPERLFQARMRLAYGHFYATDFDRAEAVLGLLERSGPAQEPAHRDEIDGLRASLARDRGHLLEARRLSLRLAGSPGPGPVTDAGERWWHLAQAERALGRYAAALIAERRSRRERERHEQGASPILNHAALTAWSLAGEVDAPDDAARNMAPLVARTHQAFGDSVYTASALLAYAQAQRRLDRPERAEPLLREAVRLAGSGSGGSAFDAAAPKVELASTLVDLGRPQEVRALLEAADSAYARAGGDDDPRRWFLRLVAARIDPLDPAGALHSAWGEHRPDEGRDRPQALQWLAEAEVRAGRIGPARALWRDALTELDRQGRPLSVEAWRAHAGLAATGLAAERAIACAQAVRLFGVASAQARGCDGAHAESDSWPQPTAAQRTDLERLGALVEAAVPLDAGEAKWLERIEASRERSK
ncbi:protein kinase [Dokdonella sp.]|uniref:protein kinase domain-containing protein n=1 Tax=Dokdonella sp. TaxID=2291710 RepID=UPI0026322105|nr:protein kinase [Dokdonella sp.]